MSEKSIKEEPVKEVSEQPKQSYKTIVTDSNGNPMYLASQFAELIGVAPSTISNWRAKGVLHPAGECNGKDLYSYEQVEAYFMGYLFNEKDFSLIRHFIPQSEGAYKLEYCQLKEKYKDNKDISDEDIKEEAKYLMAEKIFIGVRSSTSFNPNDYLSTNQLVDWLGISSKTFYNRIKRMEQDKAFQVLGFENPIKFSFSHPNGMKFYNIETAEAIKDYFETYEIYKRDRRRIKNLLLGYACEDNKAEKYHFSREYLLPTARDLEPEVTHLDEEEVVKIIEKSFSREEIKASKDLDSLVDEVILIAADV